MRGRQAQAQVGKVKAETEEKRIDLAHVNVLELMSVAQESEHKNLL